MPCLALLAARPRGRRRRHPRRTRRTAASACSPRSPVAVAAADLGIPVIKADRLDADGDRAHRRAATRPRRDRRLRRARARAAAVAPRATAGSTCTSRCCPRWRGAAPGAARAHRRRRRSPGPPCSSSCPELDAGDVFGQRSPRRSAATQTAGRPARRARPTPAPQLLLRVVDAIADGTARGRRRRGRRRRPHPSSASTTARIDWSARGAVVSNLIRGVTPGARRVHRSSTAHALKVLAATRRRDGTRAAAPGSSATRRRPRCSSAPAATPLELLAVQPAGKNRCPPPTGGADGTRRTVDRRDEVSETMNPRSSRPRRVAYEVHQRRARVRRLREPAAAVGSTRAD